MGRQKEIAKKRRFEEGSSSRAPTCNDDQAPEEDDSLLGTRVLCALNPEQLALVDHYKMRKLIGRKYLDLGILQEFGFNLSVVQLLRHRHWGKNMERNELVNMGVQVKKWLAAQFKANVQTVFVGPLVTELCHALGLEAKLAREKIEARMVAISIPEFVSMGLRLGDWESMRAFQLHIHQEQMALRHFHGNILTQD
nr:hypothetical protein Iba_chr12aCG10130 [Ipomoea batatas]